MKPAEIRSLTGVRGFAALWVVFFHFTVSGPTRDLDAGALINRGYWAVDLFFLLSGFVLAHVYSDAWRNTHNRKRFYVDFIRARFARVYPLHAFMFLMFGLLVGAATLAGKDVSAATYSLREAALHLFLLHGIGFSGHLAWNDPSWSVSAEFFAYAFLFVPVLVLLRSGQRTLVLLLVVGSWLLFWGMAMLLPQQSVDVTWQFGGLRIIPSFLAGMLLFRVNRGAPMDGRTGDAMFLVCLLTLFVLSHAPSALEVFLLPVMFALVWSLAASGPIVNGIFANPVSLYLGRISFALYMVHAFIKVTFTQLLLMSGTVLVEEQVFIGFFVLLAASLAGGVLAHHLVEQPARRWILAPSVPRVPRWKTASNGSPGLAGEDFDGVLVRSG